MSDAPALGCAILAAVAAGLHPDVPSATAAMVRVSRTILPDPARHAVYRRLFEQRYSRLYPALKPLFHDHAHDAPPAAGENGGGQQQAAEQQQAASSPAGLPRAIISPSILAADFAALGDEVQRVLDGGADWVHVDMFDGGDITGGNFTIGPPVVAALRKRAPGAFLDCHTAVQVRVARCVWQGDSSLARGLRRGVALKLFWLLIVPPRALVLLAVSAPEPAFAWATIRPLIWGEESPPFTQIWCEKVPRPHSFCE